MRYVAHVHVLDIMEEVVLYAEVLGHDPLSLEGGPVLKMSTTLHGVGEDDPRSWLRSALTTLLETL